MVFPVGFVDPAKDPKTALDKPYTGLPDNADQEYWDRCECAHRSNFFLLLIADRYPCSSFGCTDDPERWAGLPINLQVVGKRLQDEELLGLAKVIRDAGATLH